jgi:hypothetical protein
VKRSGLQRKTELRRTDPLRVKRKSPTPRRARPCERCGDEFVPRDECVSRQRKYCSRECARAVQRETADAQLPTRDEVAPFFDANVSDAEVGRHYGRSAWWARQLRARYGFPAWRQQRGEAVDCEHCGETFYAQGGELARGKGRFCSRKCRYKAGAFPPGHHDRLSKQLRKDRKGEGNPGFKHGRYVGKNTVRRSKFSLAVKGEDRCRNCGSRDRLNLHHVFPRSFHKAAREEIRNGLPLCHHCHRGWHERTVTICRDVFTEEEWAYLRRVRLTGQKTMPWLDERYPEKLAGARIEWSRHTTRRETG